MDNKMKNKKQNNNPQTETRGGPTNWSGKRDVLQRNNSADTFNLSEKIEYFEDFNLSDKIEYLEDDSETSTIGMLRVSDVKEFIKRLRDRILLHRKIFEKGITNHRYFVDYVIFEKEIDKLVGEDLK
jgi:hypothetical protein